MGFSFVCFFFFFFNRTLMERVRAMLLDAQV